MKSVLFAALVCVLCIYVFSQVSAVKVSVQVDTSSSAHDRVQQQHQTISRKLDRLRDEYDEVKPKKPAVKRNNNRQSVPNVRNGGGILGLNIAPQWLLNDWQYPDAAADHQSLGPSIVRWNFNMDPFAKTILDPASNQAVNFDARYVPLLKAYTERGMDVLLVLMVGKDTISHHVSAGTMAQLGEAYAEACRFFTASYFIPHGVINIELGNEPNDHAYWPTHGYSIEEKQVYARDYMEMLSRAYPAVKNEYNNAGISSNVMMAGISFTDAEYLNHLYSFGLASNTDKIVYHPYDMDGDLDKVGQKINDMQNVMNSWGDGEKKHWLTEYGVQGPPSDGEAMNWQSWFVGAGVAYMQQYFPQVEKAVWFNLADFMNGAEYMGYGLRDMNNNNKPAHDAFIQTAAGNLPMVSGSNGKGKGGKPRQTPKKPAPIKVPNVTTAGKKGQFKPPHFVPPTTKKGHGLLNAWHPSTTTTKNRSNNNTKPNKGQKNK
jgi:hypothetical protein